MGRDVAVPLSDLPVSSPLMLPLVCERFASGRYLEVGGVRLRHFGTRVDCEFPLPDGYWQNWYVELEPTPHVIVSLEQVTMITSALARRARGSKAASIAEQYAPLTSALSRNFTTTVQGMRIAAVPIASGPPNDQMVALGLTPQETMLSTLVLIPLSEELPQTIDEVWIGKSASAVEPAWSVWFECQQVMEYLIGLDASMQRSILKAEMGDWKGTLAATAKVAGDLAKILEFLGGVRKLLGS